MKIEEMTLADVEARLAEIDAELETRSGEELDALKAEVVELQERKAILADLEQRQADAKALEEQRATEPVKEIETRKEEKTMQKIEEYRNSEEYINAYADYIKTGKDEEVRKLLILNTRKAETWFRFRKRWISLMRSAPPSKAISAATWVRCTAMKVSVGHVIS